MIGLLFGAPLLRGLTQPRAPPPPPESGSFPSFSLESADGSRLTADALRGHSFVAGVLCEGCAEAMRTLQHRTRNLGDALWLVSFSRSLTMPSLQAVARAHGAGARWRFVQGIPDDLQQLLGDGESVVLVDASSKVRGLYRILQQGEIDRLLRDCALVAALH